MTQVTVDEIVDSLMALDVMTYKKGEKIDSVELAKRIKAHGIAPPFEYKLLEARMGVLFEFLENVCSVSSDERVATIAKKILDTAKTNGIAPPDGMRIDEIINQFDELLEANLEYTEETKRLRLFIRTKMAEALQHGIAPPDGYCIVPIATLKHWRNLGDLNPKDLAPRIDAYLKETK